MPDPHRKTTELIEGVDYTIENGAWVFTESFHLRRGSCCDSGCRHCPFKPREGAKATPLNTIQDPR